MSVIGIRNVLASILFAVSAIGLWSQAASHTQATYDAAAHSAQRKFDHIEQNGKQAHPDSTPTILTEREINAWFASGEADLPKGVRNLKLQADPGIIHGTADVDFDQVLFSGVHQVTAVAHGQGASGTGQVHIDSVSLDGVAVPRMALEYFVDRYIRPKYLDLGIDSTFKLPNRIDRADVGSHEVTVVQK
jgi:hypothetical protein